VLALGERIEHPRWRRPVPRGCAGKRLPAGDARAMTCEARSAGRFTRQLGYLHLTVTRGPRPRIT
jgi:hypothetical protein